MSYYIVCRGRLVIVERLPHRTKRPLLRLKRDAYIRVFHVRTSTEYMRNA